MRLPLVTPELLGSVSAGDSRSDSVSSVGSAQRSSAGAEERAEGEEGGRTIVAE